MVEMKHGIVEAAQRPTVLEAALAYLELGISAIPLRGKVPSTEWTTYQLKRAAYSYAHEWHKRGLLENVGIVCGAVSGNLCVIDLDGLEAVATFRDAFPKFHRTTYTVKSGSGKGLHIYLLPEKLPPTTRTKGFELRANGTQVVAPPSRHPDTRAPYSIFVELPILVVPDLDDVVAWITAMIKKDQQPVPAVQPRRAAAPAPVQECKPETPEQRRARRYAEIGKQYYFNRAIEGEISRVLAASPGDQNNTLFRAVGNLARKINAGLSIDRIENAMMDAAWRSGYVARDGERAALATIRSAIKTVQQQRDVKPSQMPTEGDRNERQS